MLNDILTAAALPARETSFRNPPEETYGVYMDEVTAEGGDYFIGILTHDITLELYERQPDPAKESAVEAALNVRGIPWTKQARYWLDSIRRYQVVYEFTYIEKI